MPAGAGGAHQRGHSTRPGASCSSRGHSTPSGTAIPSPHAQDVPGRKKSDPHAWNVPSQDRCRRDVRSGCSDSARGLSVLDAVAVLVEVVALIIDGAEVHPAIGDLLGEVLPGHDANFASAFLELLITH